MRGLDPRIRLKKFVVVKVGLPGQARHDEECTAPEVPIDTNRSASTSAWKISSTYIGISSNHTTCGRMPGRAPAVGAGEVDGKIVSPLGDQSAMIAARLEKLAMHVDDAAHAAALVQVVDVLRAEKKFAAARGEARFEPRERAVRFVRLRGLQVATA